MEYNCKKFIKVIECLIEGKKNLEKQVSNLTKELFETNKKVFVLVAEFEEINANLIRSDEKKRHFLNKLKEANLEQLKRIKEQEQALIQVDSVGALGQLAAGIAHEINNPTTFIRSNIELVDKYVSLIIQSHSNNKYKIEDLLNSLDEVLKSMYKGTDRITSIVNGLKCFSRQETVIFKPVDLYQCIKEAYKLIQIELKKSKVRFKCEIKEDMYTIYGSFQQLEQVFVNLFINSINALNKAENTKKYIKIKVIMQDKKNVNIYVSDNGCGIDTKIQKMVFNPFYTTDLNEGGTGLGLSIIYGIVKGHNGNITLISNKGEGAEFLIVLPLYQSNGG